MKTYFYLLLLILISCNIKKEETTNDFSPKNKLKKFEYLTQEKEFSSVFKLVDSIQLETKKGSLIGKPWGVGVTKDYFFILDLIYNNSVLAFSKDGKFINQIGKIGEGPAEYKYPNAIVVSGQQILVYDPGLSRITSFRVNDFGYVKSWHVKKYYESLTSIKDKIILLNRFGQGYSNDYEIYNIDGDFIGEGKLPKSLAEYKRPSLFGGSFKIANNKDRLIYIGADDYRLVCININTDKVEWVSNKIPTELKLPELPSNIRKLGYKWLIDNYSPLYGLCSFENGLIIVQADNYFFLYDNNGNYLTTLFNRNRRDVYTSDGQYLYRFTDAYEDKKGNVINPKIYVYSLINNT